MEDTLNAALGAILYVLGLAYTHEWFVPFVLMPIMLIWAGVLHWRAAQSMRPYLSAASERATVLKAAIGDDGAPEAQHAGFADNFLDVSATMEKDGPGAAALVEAWREFKESFVDETANPIRNTSRPSVFFGRVSPRLTDLTFASNVFVGAGLILTFLGLIVALGEAADGMKGDDISGAKDALAGLLTVAGAKFFTSVAGLGASIWLRIAEHRLSKKAKNLTDQICGHLERGLLYVPPQRLAVEQLEVLKEQRDQLKTFNTDFAMQLGDRIGQQFQAAMAPMASSMAQMADSMTEVTAGIGDGARKAIEEVSGDQLRGLSEVLGTLGLKIEQISSAVGSSGDEAARQIRDAGADFSKAAADIREAFDRLAGQVDGMGDRLQTQSESAAKAQDETMQRVLGELSAAQAKSADAMSEAVEGLRKAGLEAATTMQTEVQTALAAGAAEGQRALAGALEESGDTLRTTALGLAKAVGDAAGSVERASAGFVQSGESAARSADALSSVTGQANTLATRIGEAGASFGAVAAPIVKAAQAVDAAVSKIQTAIESGRAADADTLKQMQELAVQMKGVAEAAEEAWDDYRKRFAEVDKALAGVADKMTLTLSDSLTRFSQFAQSTDSEMATAVGKLSSTMSAIEDYAEVLGDYVEATVRQREPAE